MKTILITLRILIFSLIITGIYSFKTPGPDKATIARQNDQVSKKGIVISGAQEVPAVNTSGSGTLDVTYNKSTKTLEFSAKWSDLSDTATMMHFHGPADRGTNAGVVFPIHDFTHGTSGTATGSVKLDEVKMKEADLLAGKWYYNIHTKTHPAGEIRGQVEF